MSLQCPNCRVELVMSDRQGVEIDYCPKCRGVWLDRGELDKILERAEGQTSAPQRTGQAVNASLFGGPPVSPPSPPPQRDTDQGYRPQRDHRRDDDDDDDRRRYGPGKRKSWLSDIFD
jgi:uncharacterized protein